MAVSKRLRYEVLRRDNHACRYCGRSAPDVELTIDHVVPVALSGDDKPANLITACVECNSGKSASSPDAALIEDVAQDAIRWSRAMAAAAGEMLAQASGEIDAQAHFEKAWARYGSGTERRPLPKDPGWRQTVDSLLSAGLPMGVLEECIQVAMSQRKVAEDNVFRYMCGVAWRKVSELQQRARELAQNAPSPAGDNHEDLEDVADTAIQNWCRIILGQRDPHDVETATRNCVRYAEDDSPSGVLWFIIHNLELNRAGLRDCLLDLMRALPEDIGVNLIREHEEQCRSSDNSNLALTTAAQYAAGHMALTRGRAELALLPENERETWIQRARDEYADIAEHLSEDYYVSEGARMARETQAASTPQREG